MDNLISFWIANACLRRSEGASTSAQADFAAHVSAFTCTFHERAGSANPEYRE